MKIEVTYFDGIANMRETTRVLGRQFLNRRAKIVDEKPQLIAYSITPNFLNSIDISDISDATVDSSTAGSSTTDSVDYTDFTNFTDAPVEEKLRRELKQAGIVLFVNVEKRTLEINQFDNIWTED